MLQSRSSKIITRLALAALVLLACFSAMPQVSPAVTPPASSPSAPLATATPPTATPELIALREQNKVIREYHSSLLDTVYWALGGVFTFAALLSGFGWWSNFRVYDADKKRLKEELEAQLKDFESKAAIREKEVQQATLLAVDGKLDGLSARVTAESGELRREASALRLELTKAIETANKPVATVTDRIAELTRGLAETESELRHVEEYVWALKQNTINVLITQGQGVTAAVNAKNKFYLSNVLKRMKTTIEQELVAKNVEVNASIVEMVKSRITSAAADDPLASAELLGLLAKVKVKPAA